MKRYYASENHNPTFRPGYALLPFYAAFFILSIIIVLKAYAAYVSGSASLLASLLDSVGDGAISFMTFLSLKLSLKPADKEHRYGHGKIEGFAALFQSSFLMGAAIFLCLETSSRIFTPVEVSDHWLAIHVSIVTIVLSGLLIFIQNHAFKYAPSLALEADQKHYTSDIALNGGVILALLADLWATWGFVDLLVSYGVAAFMIWTSVQIGRDAVNMLMDREIDESDRERITSLVLAHDQVQGMHDLRTRKSGMNIYISFDVELDATLSLEKAHAITRDLDHALLEIFPNAEIIIHKDPAGDPYDPRHKLQGIHH